MVTSEFISTSDKQESSNGKSVTSVVYIGGKKYFKKQLSAENRHDLRHKMAMYKEFDVGRNSDCKYIVKYITINEDENGLYLLTEHVNGLNIADKIKEEPEYFKNNSNTERMLKQLLVALGELHRRNIAYSDMRPENIMLTQISNEVRLVDLGGCLTDSNDYTTEATEGFGAPELCEDKNDRIDARTDIYAVGKLLEYIEEKAGATFSKQLKKIMARCLIEDKTKRFQTTDELTKALNKKGKIAWAAAISLVLIIAATIGWQWFQTTEEYKALALEIKTDFKRDGVYYMITSEDSSTCMAIGFAKNLNLYIEGRINIDGKTYLTTAIADSAFKHQRNLQSVFLPNTLRRIGEQAFYNCKSLVTAAIPEGIVKTEFGSFKRAGLRNLKLPKSLKIVGHASFAECRNLKSLDIPEGVETLELDAFACCDSLKNISLPSTLKTISRGVFWKCFSLEEIHIPASVKTIGEYSFYYCKSLKHVYNHSTEPQELTTIFNSKDITIHVPAASLDKYRKAHHWREMNLVGDL